MGLQFPHTAPRDVHEIYYCSWSNVALSDKNGILAQYFISPTKPICSLLKGYQEILAHFSMLIIRLIWFVTSAGQRKSKSMEQSINFNVNFVNAPVYIEQKIISLFGDIQTSCDTMERNHER